MSQKRFCCAFMLAVLMAAVFSFPVLADPPDPLVLAFYYAWFDMETWKLSLSDQPVAPYLSANSATIEQHVIQARDAGIDALVQAWYGPDLQNNQTESNFSLLLDSAQRQGTSAAVSVDMGGAFLQDEASIKAALVALRDRHAQHAAYLRVDGRPVVFFWQQQSLSVSSWDFIRDEVDPNHTMLWIAEGARTEYLAVFDGLYLYSVAWSSDPASVLTRWGTEVRQWSSAYNTSRYWVATTMPGYNDLVTGRADAFVRDRAAGTYYRDCWRGARESNADWVVITSFNEWLEGSYIEPSVNYDTTYLDLTAQLAAEYRNAALAPTPTLVLPTSTPTVSPTVTATPSMTPTATPSMTPTAMPTFEPTATITPTATPFRLATPTPEIVATGTFPPTADLPPAPTVRPYVNVTATSEYVRPMIFAPSGDNATTKRCSLLPALIPLLAVLGGVRRRSLW